MSSKKSAGPSQLARGHFSVLGSGLRFPRFAVFTEVDLRYLRALPELAGKATFSTTSFWMTPMCLYRSGWGAVATAQPSPLDAPGFLGRCLDTVLSMVVSSLAYVRVAVGPEGASPPGAVNIKLSTCGLTQPAPSSEIPKAACACHRSLQFSAHHV